MSDSGRSTRKSGELGDRPFLPQQEKTTARSQPPVRPIHPSGPSKTGNSESLIPTARIRPSSCKRAGGGSPLREPPTAQRPPTGKRPEERT